MAKQPRLRTNDFTYPTHPISHPMCHPIWGGFYHEQQRSRNKPNDDKATINTKPQLEIFADDVKCSHGCTIGQLDKDALFYLRARGIPKIDAKALLTYAFANNVLENVNSIGFS